MRSQIIILGAGPTGLGAANRLEQHGYRDWTLFEATGHAGGLASSVVDEEGFTWDLGGHVQFSHYEYFDDLMARLLARDEWLYHDRESWVWIRDRFVPYPFQLNLRHLPEKERTECVLGLENLVSNPPQSPPRDLGQWIDQTFGAGLARIFMRPYNFKVWAYPPEDLDWNWVGDRVAVVDLERVKRNICEGKDDVSWGPNNQFRFPKHGGTGVVWRRLSDRLPRDKQHFHMRLIGLTTRDQRLQFENGTMVEYQNLISSIPLDELVHMSDLEQKWRDLASQLRYSSTHVFGVGLRGQPHPSLRTKCWIYFPEENCPFYRVTVFSNYSPHNVPDISRYWSLMAEVSESTKKLVDLNCLGDQVRKGLVATGLIPSEETIHHTWHRRLDHGYPTPFLRRNEILTELRAVLEERNIYSRGRFGAWLYEVSNQDHSVAQGVECVDRLLDSGEEITINYPALVNRQK